MTPAPADNLTLDDLCADASKLLRRHGLLDAQPDGRVNSAPDPRTVRYYGTLGLVDRPKIVEREARYGWKHILQVLAIKALQFTGLGLIQIQSRLYGRTEAELETVLRTVTESRAKRPAPVTSVTWKEIAIEPGVRLMVEEGWTAGADPEALVLKLRAALAALSGGKNDETR